MAAPVGRQLGHELRLSDVTLACERKRGVGCNHKQGWHTTVHTYCIERHSARTWFARSVECGRRTIDCATYREPAERAEREWWQEEG